MSCSCVGCALGVEVREGKVDVDLAAAFMAGYHYYGAGHTKDFDDVGWHMDGMDYYLEWLLKERDDKRVLEFIKVVRKANKKIRKFIFKY